MASNGEITNTQIAIRLIIFVVVVSLVWYFLNKMKKDAESKYSSSKQLAIYPRLTGIAPMDRQILENFNHMNYAYKC